MKLMEKFINDSNLLEKHSLDETKPDVYVGLHKGAYWLHWHDQLELLLFLTDNTKVLCDDKLFPIQYGDLLVINPCVLHQNFGGRYYCIHIRKDFFKDMGCDSSAIMPYIKADENILHMVEQMCSASQEKNEWSLLEVKALAYQLMAYLVKNYKAETKPEGKETAKVGKTGQVNQILDHVANHCHEKITTASLAQICHLNENYLCALFKSKMGVTIGEYIKHFRMEKATVLLTSTSFSITEIASQVGFDDPGYFTRIFRQHTGVTPREYRKNEKKSLAE